MMRKHLLISILLLWSSCYFLHAQNFMTIIDSMSATGATFDEITKAVDKAWEGKFQGKHSGRKQYERWKYYNSTRLDENGRLINTSKTKWDEFYAPSKSVTGEKAAYNFNGNWESTQKTAFNHWSNGYSGGMGRVNCIAFDPANNNIIYVGTPGGGLWRSTDGGSSWSPMIDGMPRLGVSSIVIDPTSPVANRTIYILTGDGDGADTESLGVYKSIDNGTTWMSTGLTSSINRSYKLLMHPSQPSTIYAATEPGVYKTTNGGLNWTLQTLPGYLDYDRVADLEFHPTNPNILYASTMYGNVYKTINGGQNWAKLSGSVLPSETDVYKTRAAIAVTPANPDYLYVLYSFTTSDFHFGGVYRSTDAGASFTLQSNAPNILGGEPDGQDYRSQNFYDLCISASPVNADEVHVGSINSWKSVNGGVTWSLTSDWVEFRAGAGNYTHADFHALEWDANNNLYCGTDGGINKSTDAGENWANLSFGLEITQFYRIGGKPNSPDMVLGGAQDNGSMFMDNTNTMHQWYGGDGGECLFDPVKEGTFYGSAQNGQLIKATNNGTYISPITPKENGVDVYGSWITPYTLDPTNSDVIYAGYIDMYKSTDAGTTWINLTKKSVDSANHFTDVKVSRANPNYIFGLKNTRLYASKDGGATWSMITSQLPANWGITGFTIDPNNENKLWVYSHVAAYKSTDCGANWTMLPTAGFPAQNKNTIVYQEGSDDGIYLGADFGVYYIDNTMSSWLNFSNGLVNVEVYELEINYYTKKLRAATYGRGVWESDLYINCNDGVTISIPAPAKSANKAIGSTYTIQAESFTGTGGTYNDAPSGGPGYGVKNNGTSINYVNIGDWATYNLPANIESGIYEVNYYLSTPMTTSSIALAVDGNLIMTDAVPSNGGWESYQLRKASKTITLQSGVNSTIKLTATGSGSWAWNMDRFVLAKVAELQVSADSVVLSQKNRTMDRGTSETLLATVYPANATNKNLSWTSNNTAVATVSNGLVTAVGLGNAVITATTQDGSRTATCAITVVEPPFSILIEAENRASIPGAFTTYQIANGAAVEANNDQRGIYSLPASYPSGMYRIEYNVASAINGVSLEITTDHIDYDEKVTVTVPNQGNWNSFAWVASSTYLNLERNRNYSLFITAKGPSGKVLNLDNFRLVRVGDLNIPVQSMTYISESSFAQNPGDLVQLIAKLTPLYSSRTNVTWASSNESVASINSPAYFDVTSGQASIWIKTLTQGTATVTATTEDGNHSLVYTITVQGAGNSVVDVNLSESEVYLAIGDSYQLTETVLPETAGNKNVTWASSTPSSATVNANGLITAVAAGTTTITVTTAEGNFSKSCLVHVLASTDVITIEGESRVAIPSTFSTYPSSAGTAIEATSGQQGAYQIPAWLMSGEYLVDYSIGSAIDGASIEFRSDDLSSQVTTNVPNVGSWDVFQRVREKQTINLDRTRNYSVYLRANGPTGKVFNLDKFRLLRIGNLNVRVSSFEIYENSDFTLEEGIAQILQAKILPIYATNTTVHWTSSNINIASVAASTYFDPYSGIASCFVTAVSTGTATITATTVDGNYSVAFNITVTPRTIPVTGVLLSAAQQTLNIGQTFQLTETVQPGTATNKTVSWSSSDATVASVSATGLVTALKGGNAQITVTTNNGNFSAACSITVNQLVEVIVEAETFTATGGTTNDSQWGGPGLGAKKDGTIINWVNTNDWVRYPITIAKAGKYELQYTIATPITVAKIEFSVNGVAYNTDPVTATTSWNIYRTQTSNRYYEFYPGTYTIQLKGVGTNGWEWNLDKFKLTKVDEICVSPVNLKRVVKELPGTYAGPMPGLIQEISQVDSQQEWADRGISEPGASVFSFYPNPASGQITLSFGIEQDEPVSIRILNVVGTVESKVYQNELQSTGSYELNFDVSSLAAGIYFVQYTHGSETTIQKLVIE